MCIGLVFTKITTVLEIEQERKPSGVVTNVAKAERYRL